MVPTSTHSLTTLRMREPDGSGVGLCGESKASSLCGSTLASLDTCCVAILSGGHALAWKFFSAAVLNLQPRCFAFLVVFYTFLCLLLRATLTFESFAGLGCGYSPARQDTRQLKLLTTCTSAKCCPRGPGLLQLIRLDHACCSNYKKNGGMWLF